MYCAHCGNEISANMTFCPNCGTKQNVENNTSFEVPSTVPTKNKYLKSSVVSVILNIIATFLFLVFEIYFINNFKSKLIANVSFQYVILFSLLLSIAVLIIKNNNIKILFSVIQLLVALSTPLLCFFNIIYYEGNMLFQLIWAIFLIVASVFSLLHSLTIKRKPETSFDNKKINKLLCAISTGLIVSVVALFLFISNDALTISKVIYEIRDENYTNAVEMIENSDVAKDSKDLLVWCNYNLIYSDYINAAESEVITNLKDPTSFENLGNTFNRKIYKNENDDNILISGNLNLYYSATNSFGARVKDTHFYLCPEKAIDFSGYSVEEIEEIVSLSKDEVIEKYNHNLV